VKYIQYSDFPSALRNLFQSGGNYQKAAIKVQAMIGRAILEEDPFLGIKLTKHGENRIPHCVKYDLEEYCRLITVQDNGCCAFVFVGKHADCDRWILHDVHRVNKGDRGSFDHVMRGLKFLKKHKIDFNILVTVYDANQHDPLEVYRFVREELAWLAYRAVAVRPTTSWRSRRLERKHSCHGLRSLWQEGGRGTKTAKAGQKGPATLVNV
jgi:hypothetical protein